MKFRHFDCLPTRGNLASGADRFLVRLRGATLLAGDFRLFARACLFHAEAVGQGRQGPQAALPGGGFPGGVPLLLASRADDFFHELGGFFHGAH
jgi:hypothetical protein